MLRPTRSTSSSTTRCSWCTSSSAGRRRSSTGSASPTRSTPSDSGDALLSTAHIYSELRNKSEKRGNWPETYRSPVQWRIWSNSDQPHNIIAYVSLDLWYLRLHGFHKIDIMLQQKCLLLISEAECCAVLSTTAPGTRRARRRGRGGSRRAGRGRGRGSCRGACWRPAPRRRAGSRTSSSLTAIYTFTLEYLNIYSFNIKVQ